MYGTYFSHSERQLQESRSFGISSDSEITCYGFSGSAIDYRQGKDLFSLLPLPDGL
jgi:hypothetical protein